MTRTRHALRLSPLAFALAFGAYSESFAAGREATAAPDAEESSARTGEDRETAPQGSAAD